MDGEFIVDRKMEKMLAQIAQHRSISHEIFSDGWVHVFKKADASAKLIGYKWSINNAAASGIASDKVALYEILLSDHIPAVKHQLVRTKADHSLTLSEGAQFPLVLKPLTGTSGHAITRCENIDQLANVIDASSIAAWAISPLLEVKREVRLIMLDEDVLLAYEKKEPTGEEVPFFNLGKGAVADVIEPPSELTTLALSGMRASGLRLGAVDLVQVDDEWSILEINDGIMMEHFLRQSDDYYKLAYRVYEKIIDVLFSSK